MDLVLDDNKHDIWQRGVRRGRPITHDEEAAALEAKPHALAGARDNGGAWSYSTVWHVAERECIQLPAGRAAKGYKRLAPERRDKVIEARCVNRRGRRKRLLVRPPSAAQP
jgi:hypothetical protein